VSAADYHERVADRIQLRSSLPGRHRIWVAGLYRNERLEHALRRNLQASSFGLEFNLVTGTLLIRVEPQVPAQALLQRIDDAIRHFSLETGTSVAALEQRGRRRPVHLALDARARRPASASHPHATPQTSASASNGKPRGMLLRRFFDVGKNGNRQPSDESSRGMRLPKLRFNLFSNAESNQDDDTELSPESHLQTRWHTLEPQRLAESLEVALERGLAPQDAALRLLRYGQNELPKPPVRSGLARFCGQFKDLPVLLLAGSALLSCATGGIADGAVIMAVILVNGVIGYVTESSAERTIAGLTREGAIDAEVLRAGQTLRIPIAEVVPGDIVMLRMGSVTPADARLIEAHELSVDESALTGESLPAAKAAASIEDPYLPLGERHNMVYRGTLVTGGSGRALVMATGAHTEVGRLQTMVGEVTHPETPMQRQLRELGERSMVMAGVACGGVLVVGLLRGYSPLQMLRTAVSLAVAAVPEGLPTVAITTLAIGIQRMKERQVIVRRLDAIETLGAVQVLCFDKTGTITHNRMRVVQLAVPERELTLSAGKLRGSAPQPAPGDVELETLLLVAALCSDVLVQVGADGKPLCDGSPTEAALVQLALDLGRDVPELRAEYPRVAALQRSEQRRWMATLHQRTDSSAHLLAVKGSPLEVLERCSSRLQAGDQVPLTEEERRAIRRQNDGMSGDALRVLGLACQHYEGAPASYDEGWLWLGLVGLADPPRDGLPELIQRFRAAGIRTVMITGDQSATAYAVAKQIGLATDGELQTLDAIELDQMAPEVLAELVPQVQVFSRVSPRHKLRIVQALQRAGLVVAMTGDGINDCPALKAADVGVAMGGGKSPVAREVADVILETDDLHAMLVAIEQGRVIHADIKKAVRFILATNLSEILLTFASVAAGFGESMSPLQLLWINLVSDIFPELALALQPSEDDVLLRPPRETGAKMFSREELRHLAIEGGVLTLGALAAYGYGIKRYGLSPHARGLTFITLTATQLLHAFSTRSERHHIFDSHESPPNPYIPLSVGGGIALTLLIQLVPATRRLFGSRPLPAFDWLIAAIAAAAPLVANEITKALRYAPPRSATGSVAPAPTPLLLGS
jgi:Ca2+-transporting ATPase